MASSLIGNASECPQSAPEWVGEWECGLSAVWNLSPLMHRRRWRREEGQLGNADCPWLATISISLLLPLALSLWQKNSSTLELVLPSLPQLGDGRWSLIGHSGSSEASNSKIPIGKNYSYDVTDSNFSATWWSQITFSFTSTAGAEFLLTFVNVCDHYEINFIFSHCPLVP